MSSEVCPFCGKTYKRLKSHLPHCKAAASSKTPPPGRHVSANQTTASPQLAAAASKTAAKGKKTAAAAAETLSSSPTTSSSLSSTSLLPATKKKKQKPADQIKTASLSSPPSPTVSKPKKKSLRASTEAEKSDRVTEGSLEGTGSTSERPTADSTRSSGTRAQTETRTDPEKDSLEDEAGLTLLSAETKPRSTPKKKVSKTKRAAQPERASDFLDSELNERSAGPRARDDFWVDSEGGTEDLSVGSLLRKPGGGQRAGITLRDVKATLGRANASLKSGRPSVLSRIENTDDLGSKTRLGAGVGPVRLPGEKRKDATLSEQLHTERRSKSKQPALTPLPDQASRQPAILLLPALSATPPPPHAPPPPPPPVSLKVGHHLTGLLAISPPPSQFSSPLHFPRAQQRAARTEDAETLEVGRRRLCAESPAGGALARRSLGRVRLKELPEWLACKTPSRPREVVETMRRGWQWYYRRYIDVKKGGVAGPGMLLAGYCVLSYIWSYPQISTCLER
ncbi:mitochondrial nucleoid-associated protein 1-like [Brachyistius frenatus]|uniref:mitochondrial nucleoid-associated protein 1-like n=1 Tax=Brachyistius frenatus TaxID=100188 RepID=UPI0037E9865F